MSKGYEFTVVISRILILVLLIGLVGDGKSYSNRIKELETKVEMLLLKTY